MGEASGDPPSKASRWPGALGHLTFFCLGVVTTALLVSHRLTLVVHLTAAALAVLFVSLGYHLVRGLDYMRLNHPDYTGDDLFDTGDDLFNEEEPGDAPAPYSTRRMRYRTPADSGSNSSTPSSRPSGTS